jgi:hypothetical protein
MAEDHLPKRIGLVYQDAVDNIRFFKSQQWTVTNYAFVAYAALVGLAQLTEAPRGIYIAAVWGAFAYHAWLMRGFAKSVRKFRRRVRWVYENYFQYMIQDVGLRLVVDKPAIDRLWYARFLVIASGIAAGLATYAICTLKH